MNKEWVKIGDYHILYSKPHEDVEELARIYCNADGEWSFKSTLLDNADEWLDSDNLEDAKIEVEEFVIDMYKDEIAYNVFLLEQFTGKPYKI